MGSLWYDCIDSLALSPLRSLHIDTETRLRVLEQQLFRRQARDEIWHVITRHTRGIDEQCFDELGDIFTEDVLSQTHPGGSVP